LHGFSLGAVNRPPFIECVVVLIADGNPGMRPGETAWDCGSVSRSEFSNGEFLPRTSQRDSRTARATAIIGLAAKGPRPAIHSMELL
jgi:hypothetical protein